MSKIDRFEVSISDNVSIADIEAFIKHLQAKGFWVSLKRTFIRDGKKVWVVEVQW